MNHQSLGATVEKANSIVLISHGGQSNAIRQWGHTEIPGQSGSGLWSWRDSGWPEGTVDGDALRRVVGWIESEAGASSMMARPGAQLFAEHGTGHSSGEQRATT